MIDFLVQYIINDASFLELYGLNFMYFLVLYFVVGNMFLLICKFLAKLNLVNLIVNQEVLPKQIKFEVLHSVKSIVVFGFSVFPIIYLIRNGSIDLVPDTFLNVMLGLVLLTFWNEVHFFLVHRLMHHPFFMKKVHIIHHKSRIPTIYSVYSFHWFEAFLLSTVPLTIVPFVPFSPLAILLYPLASILLNFSGHCNYRFGKGEGDSWKVFGSHHNAHHYKGNKNYGFALNVFDKIITQIRNKKSNI